MSRARQIKPTFFLHEEVATLSHFDRLFWIGLWTLADREGRLEYRPARIKAQLFPYESSDIDASTLVLESKGFVQRCKFSDGRTILYITNWQKHQRPHQNESHSEFPPLDEGLAQKSEALALEPCILNLEPRTLNTVPVTQKRVTKPKEVETLETILDGKGSPLWEAYWKLAGIFGPAKNPAPKVTARLYHLALDSGFKVEHLHQKALELMKATSEQKFLPQLAKWLEGEGYQNPANAPINGGTNGTKPHHRSASDESYLEDVLSRPPAPIQQYTPEEFERLWGSGKAESLG